MKLLKLAFLLVLQVPIFSKVLIFTYAYNRPEFIKYQYLTFKKFMLDEYEFVVFNDARDNEMRKKIEHECKNFGLECVRIPQEIHSKPYLKRWPGETYDNACVRCANVIQYSLNELGFDH